MFFPPLVGSTGEPHKLKKLNHHSFFGNPFYHWLSGHCTNFLVFFAQDLIVNCLTIKSPAGVKRSGTPVRWTDRFGDAWQVTSSDCATSLDPGMYGRCRRLSPSHRRTRKRWRTEIASTTPDDTPRGLLRGVRAFDKLLGYRRPHSRETLPPDQVVDLRTNNMPHRRPVELPARLLVKRP